MSEIEKKTYRNNNRITTEVKVGIFKIKSGNSKIKVENTLIKVKKKFRDGNSKIKVRVKLVICNTFYQGQSKLRLIFSGIY